MTTTRQPPAPRSVAAVLAAALGPDLPVAIAAYDGSLSGPAGARTTVRLRTPQALHRIVAMPGELGFARAFVSGDLDIDGDVYDVLRLRDRLTVERLRANARAWLAVGRLGAPGLAHRPPAPPEEARLSGRRHTKRRDAAAISHHYDVGNEFYRLLLGPSMTYSCGVWPSPDAGLDAAQAAKYELVSRKLGLHPGMRLLDVGCGWGGMVLHAAREHGVRAVGVTISEPQAELARERVAAAGLEDRVEIRLADYRDVQDGPYDAISSIGMFEHVGAARLADYVERLYALLQPGGRLLNHGISRPAGRRGPLARFGFIERYVFPDGELHEVGRVVSTLQEGGFEVRHVESLREHYALTLRAWVTNLEARYDEAEALAGAGRARVWRLYLAGSALAFEDGDISVHQSLAVRSRAGASAMPLRPDWAGRPGEAAATGPYVAAG